MSARGRLTGAGHQARLPSREPRPHSGPVRTCVGCRAPGSRTALLRVVVVRDLLVVDVRRSMPGRGAWLHPDPGCLELATRRRAFGRALRHAGPFDTAVVAEFLESQLQHDAG
ncbi:YlxR family protein [Cellulomonas sp. PhB150]|uniref:YlxR family protein n=1 Tax=Cellulomonas sp. PhB150 TaxID=2485188 RepID=UPI000F4A48EF|nr:YlxR family protein [Cellulomonas sp. PhB150]